MRSHEEKVQAVERVLEAAKELFRLRSKIAGAVAASTGLSPEGVERGFTEHLEVSASASEIASLVHAVGAADECTVVLSANVFVAAVRAVALAVATAPRVQVRPSTREPHVARMLVELLGSPDVVLVDDLAFSGAATRELHVYGRDESIAEIRSRTPLHVRVRAHGAGFGAAFVSNVADVRLAAEAIASDVVAFDQRGCLSPRVVVALGEHARGEQLATAIDAELARLGQVVPRGELHEDERIGLRRYTDAMTVAGAVWPGARHLVALADESAPLVLPPPGRHVHVASASNPEAVIRLVAPFRHALVAVGTDAPSVFEGVIPSHARRSALGLMQKPLFDGPVDRRGEK